MKIQFRILLVLFAVAASPLVAQKVPGNTATLTCQPISVKLLCKQAGIRFACEQDSQTVGIKPTLQGNTCQISKDFLFVVIPAEGIMSEQYSSGCGLRSPQNAGTYPEIDRAASTLPRLANLKLEYIRHDNMGGIGKARCYYRLVGSFQAGNQ